MLLIIWISLKFKKFLRNEIQIWWSKKNIKQNQNFFSKKFERTQDVEMRSRSWSPMKVGQPRSNHISQTFHINHFTEEDKKSDSYEGSDSNKN